MAELEGDRQKRATYAVASHSISPQLKQIVHEEKDDRQC